MKRITAILSAFLLASVLLVMCKKDDKEPEVAPEEPKPVVDFSYRQVSESDLKTFSFKSLSKNYKELLWQFGDDSTSTADSVVHTFQFFGSYRIILTGRNSEGYWARKEIKLVLTDPSFDSSKVGENYILTVGGQLTVSRDNGGGPTAGEGSLKLVDGNTQTKLFIGDYSNAEGYWMKYELAQPRLVEAYTFTSGNDAPSRDPKSWVLEASNNNLDWTLLDTRTGFTFPKNDQGNDRGVTSIFRFNNATAYKYYRVTLTENNGTNAFQMSEWTLNAAQ